MSLWRRCRWLLAVVVLAGFAPPGRAAFDLSGPRIGVRVVRGGKELPISRVPSLQPGDRLWLHPEFPQAQSVRYLLIAAFLRGPTNPPPDSWFIKAETWTEQVREEGIFVTVPLGAEQALLFLAPTTGGDFGTLRNAVQGKPGAFVRAAQDLNQASLDRSRVDEYLDAVKEGSEGDAALHERSVLLARSLNLKLNQQCFERPAPQQIPCLTQESGDLVLNDGHSESMVAAITSGPSADLIGAVSTTPMAGGGYYYSYLGVFFDLARLMDNLHTAQYQYIPAMGLPRGDGLDLKLSNPPSFHKPKSVLVANLPTVETAPLPPLRPVDPSQVFCLEKSPLVLPVEGAPLAFSTDFGHGFYLHLITKSGQPLDLPAVADAARGGFVIDTNGLRPGDLTPRAEGTLRGSWGFQPFAGPSFKLRSSHSADWTLPESEQSALILGRQDVIHLRSDAACCVDHVTVKAQDGKVLQANWKAVKPDELEIRVPLQEVAASSVTIVVKQAGLAEPDQLQLRTYAEAARLDEFKIHAGDREGVLQGMRLDEVEALELNKIQFTPVGLTRSGETDQLRLAVPDKAALPKLAPGEKPLAHALLKDGRVLPVTAAVEPPRPQVTLISKLVEPGESSASVIHLGDGNELPLDGRLSFVLKTQIPATFPRAEKIEVATEDQSSDALLSVADGSLTLQDSATVLAVLDPLKSFGPSTFGALRFRPVDPDGAAGDWQPLVSLVRLPELKEVHCPRGNDQDCTLTGANLFLIDAVASDPEFVHSATVPAGFVSSALNVPHPDGTVLYLKLRDDPSAVNTAALPVLPLQPAGVQ